jgi:membrane protease YdiL (CAAX protease family)
MRSEASSDVFKVWLHFGASVLVGGWVSPILYNAGKALAEVSSDKQTNGLLEGLANLCRAAGFEDFFVVSLLLCAGIFFTPLILSLRGRSSRNCGQPLQVNPRGLRQAAAGFFLVMVLFLSIAAVLIAAGVIGWKNPDQTVTRMVLGGWIFAFGFAVFQEVIFRGIAMGIFLRAMRPVAALGLSALLFALVHFLNPGKDVHVFDPDAAGVGFEMLRKIASRFADPPAIFGTFAPLLALGGVLAYARWRTASLWLPIGLHAGWVFVNGILASVTAASSNPDSMMWMFAGASFKQGIVPLFAILLAGVLTRYLTNPDDTADTPA